MDLKDQLVIYEHMYHYYNQSWLSRWFRKLLRLKDSNHMSHGFCNFLAMQEKTGLLPISGFNADWQFKHLTVLYDTCRELYGYVYISSYGYWFDPGDIKPRRRLLAMTMAKVLDLLEEK